MGCSTWAEVSLVTRQSDTLTARRAADDFAADRGLPPSGGYSGSWYRDAYLNGWWPAGWKRWWAAYGLDPGTIIGGDIVAHQWTSTPVDQNVMVESEIVGSGGTVTDPEREEMQNTINGLVTTVADIADRIGDEILTETRRPAGVRKTELRRMVSEMQVERTAAVGPRP